MGDFFELVCKRCGNTDPRYFGFTKGTSPYCRKCISFQGEKAKARSSKPTQVDLSLRYTLSPEQRSISKKIINNYINKIDTLVYAVCGAGKTELSFGVIKYCLEIGGVVAFALPRRDVVIELFYRLKEAFPNNKVISVYGQHTSQLVGDIVVLTTHQLYRYERYFDLIVMDEIDAFPYKGSDVLESMFNRARKGPCVLMSATPSDDVLKEYGKPNHSIVELRTRFHRKDIPVPKIHIDFKPFQQSLILKKLKQYRREEKKAFIFAPTIQEAESLFSFLKMFNKGGDCVHSKKPNRTEIIERFKNGDTWYLVTTSVLERGVTFKNLQVIVFMADQEEIYNKATLVQIAGRVGRKIDAPGGDVLFLGEKRTKSMQEAIDEIKYCNTYL